MVGGQSSTCIAANSCSQSIRIMPRLITTMIVVSDFSDKTTRLSIAFLSWKTSCHVYRGAARNWSTNLRHKNEKYHTRRFLHSRLTFLCCGIRPWLLGSTHSRSFIQLNWLMTVRCWHEIHCEANPISIVNNHKCKLVHDVVYSFASKATDNFWQLHNGYWVTPLSRAYSGII